MTVDVLKESGYYLIKIAHALAPYDFIESQVQPVTRAHTCTANLKRGARIRFTSKLRFTLIAVL